MTNDDQILTPMVIRLDRMVDTFFGFDGQIPEFFTPYTREAGVYISPGASIG
jgi:hypothetical protein